MLEWLSVIALIGTPLLTYFVGRKAIRKGIFEGYCAVMNDIQSEETQSELKGIAQGIVQSGIMKGAQAGLGSVKQQFKLGDVLGMIVLGYAQKMGMIPQLPTEQGGTPQTATPISGNPLKID